MIQNFFKRVRTSFGWTAEAATVRSQTACRGSSITRNFDERIMPMRSSRMERRAHGRTVPYPDKWPWA